MLNKCLIFTSDSCKDCFALKSNFTKLTDEFPTLEFEFIDVDQNPQLGIDHQIYTLPSIELYNDEKLVAEFKHGQNKQFTHIINFIKVHMELSRRK